MQQEETVQFDLNQFYDILTSLSIKDKLKPFVRQFKKKNMPFINQTIVNIIQVFNSKKQMPLMKFNALMATKLFFDTGQYIPITLIEIYLLPIIFEVALYRLQKRTEEGLTLYFIEKGYDSTKEMKRIGFNFVLLAVQFLFMSAQVKPYRNLENTELADDSNYTKYLKILMERGVQPVENYKFYIPSYVSRSRKRFLKKLSRFDPDEYIDFFLKLTCDQINLNKKPELDLKKLINYGDAYLTIPLMNICEEQLSNMDNNFINKKKYLILLGQFMKAGDIYAVLIITRSSFLEAIYQKVKHIKGQISLDSGQKIFPEVQASKADKRQFYIEYLKHVDIWAYCHPVDEEGEPTDAKKIFETLKNTRKFIFPPNILISKINAEMEANLKINQNRNEQLIKLIDDSSNYESRRKTSLVLRESRASRRSQKNKGNVTTNSYIEFDQIEQMVVNAKKKLDLVVQLDKLPQTIASLERFKKHWEVVTQKKQIDVDQSQDIELVLEQGGLCVKIIEMVIPVYNLYSKKMITYEEYLDRVNLLMKNQEESIKQYQEPEISLENQLSEKSKIEQVESYKETSEYLPSSIHSNIQNSSNIKIERNGKEVHLEEPSKSNLKSEVKAQSSANSKIGSPQVSKIKQKKKNYNDYDIQFNGSPQSHKSREQISSVKSGKPIQFTNSPKDSQLSKVVEGKKSVKPLQFNDSLISQVKPSSISARPLQANDSEISRVKQSSISGKPMKSNDSLVSKDNISSRSSRNVQINAAQPSQISEDRQSNRSSRLKNLKKVKQSQISIEKFSNKSSSKLIDFNKQDNSRGDITNLMIQKQRQQQQNSSLRSSRSSKSNRSSRVIVNRIGANKNQKLKQSQQKQSDYQYKDIVNKTNRWEDLLNKNYAQKQSFISSENSSLKQNKRSRISIKQGRNLANSRAQASRVSRQQNIGESPFDDYYGDNIKSKKSKKANGNSRIKLQASKKSNGLKNQEPNQGSMINNSYVSEYNSDTFKILSENQDSKQKHVLQEQKNESKFSFTSKDEIKSPNSPTNFKDFPPLSILSRYDGDDSKIQEPLISPLLHSFHQLKDDDITTPSKSTSFKNCFDLNNEIISTKENNSKIFKFTKTGKIVNFIQTVYSKQTPRNSTIIDMISERNAKNSIQNYRNERQRYREAQTQSLKARSLESFNKNMRMKIIMKKQTQFKREQKPYFQPSNQSQPVSFQKSSQWSRQKSQSNTHVKMFSKQLKQVQYSEKTRTINTNIYNHYFPQSKSDKIKKCMIKTKGLILKNEQFEIGFVTNRREKYIDISLFITPLKDKIQDLNFAVTHDQNLCVNLFTKSIQVIQANQQEYVNLQIAIQNVPYVLPTLSLKFKQNKRYTHNQLLLTIPCSFNKFFNFHSVSQPFLNQFDDNNKEDHIKIEAFKYSTRMLHPDKIKQNLNHFTLLQRKNRTQVYGSQAHYKGKIFVVKFSTNDKGTLELQGINMTGDHKNTKFLQFLLITFRQIFESSKKVI